MKNLFFSTIMCFAIISCRNNENPTDVSREEKVAILEQVLESPAAKEALASGNSEKVKLLVNDEFSKRNLSIPKHHGPYNLIVPTGELIASNRKIGYYGNTNYPPIGMYIADIYKYEIKVELPFGAIGRVTDVYSPGYSDYNNQRVYGFLQHTSMENGKSFLVASTYAIRINYNAIGQFVGITLPTPLTSKRFTYEYYTF